MANGLTLLLLAGLYQVCYLNKCYTCINYGALYPVQFMAISGGMVEDKRPPHGLYCLVKIIVLSMKMIRKDGNINVGN